MLHFSSPVRLVKFSKLVLKLATFQVWDYIAKLRTGFTKEVLLMELRPASADQKKSFNDFFEYLKKRNR